MAEFKGTPKFDKKTGEPVEEPKPEVQPQPTFTMEDVMKLFTSFAQEMKKPNEVEQWRYEQDRKKVDEELDRRKKIARTAAEEAKREAWARTKYQDLCNHQKPDGTTRFIAQVNSDGYARFFCNNPDCRLMLPKVKAPDSWKTEGIQTQAAADVSGPLRFLTKAMILQWHKGTVPDCQEPCCKKVAEAVPVGA